MVTTKTRKVESVPLAVNTLSQATTGSTPREVELSSEQAAALCMFVKQARSATPELRNVAAKSRKFKVVVP